MSAKMGIFAAELWFFLADRTMEYISVKQYAEKFNISERTARNYCASGKIDGAYLVGKSWNIPADAVLPGRKKKARTSPLLAALQEQQAGKIKGGIYHRVQIDLTYMPGSSVYGILQARILEWVAKPSSRRSSQPRD